MTPSLPPGSRRDFLRLTGLASAGLAMAACGTPSAPAAGPAPATSASGSAVPSPSATSARPVPRGKPVQVSRDNTLMLCFSDGTDVGIGNPYAAGFNHQAGTAAMFEPLWFYGAFNGVTTPWLADADKKPNFAADFKSVEIYTRSDALWNDGEKFTAKDVAFTLNMLRDKKNTAMSYSSDMREWVKDAVATSETVCKVTFNKPAPRFVFDYLYFKNDLGVYLVPEHIFSQQKDLNAFLNYDPSKKWPCTTGPYYMADWTNQQRLMDRREDWWAIKAGLAQLPAPTRVLVVPFTDATSTAQQLINNELDSSLDLRPPVIKQVVESNPAMQTWTAREAPYGYVDWWPQSLFFNCALKPFDDVDIRRAINHTIDRQQLVDVGYEGAGTISELPFPNFPPLQKYLDACKPLLAKYPVNALDLNKTTEIMSGKGYKRIKSKGDMLWADSSGKVIDCTIYGIQDLNNDYGAILAEQLRKGGFNASLQTPADTGTRMANGSAPMFILGFAGALADPFPSLVNMTSDKVSKIGVSGSTNARWKSAAFDKVIQQMGVLPVNDPKELPLFLKAMEIYLKEIPHVSIVQWYHRVPLNTKYWTGWPSSQDPFLPAAFWFTTLPLEITHLKKATA